MNSTMVKWKPIKPIHFGMFSKLIINLYYSYSWNLLISWFSRSNITSWYGRFYSQYLLYHNDINNYTSNGAMKEDNKIIHRNLNGGQAPLFSVVPFRIFCNHLLQSSITMAQVYCSSNIFVHTRVAATEFQYSINNFQDRQFGYSLWRK